jgi:hypothetical protein
LFIPSNEIELELFILSAGFHDLLHSDNGVARRYLPTMNRTTRDHR